MLLTWPADGATAATVLAVSDHSHFPVASDQTHLPPAEVAELLDEDELLKDELELKDELLETPDEPLADLDDPCSKFEPSDKYSSLKETFQ